MFCVSCKYNELLSLQPEFACMLLFPNFIRDAGNFLTSCKPVSFSRWTLHHGVSKEVSNCIRNFISNFMIFFNLLATKYKITRTSVLGL